MIDNPISAGNNNSGKLFLMVLRHSSMLISRSGLATCIMRGYSVSGLTKHCALFAVSAFLMLSHVSLNSFSGNGGWLCPTFHVCSVSHPNSHNSIGKWWRSLPATCAAVIFLDPSSTVEESNIRQSVFSLHLVFS